jgi:hypothetical protein
MVALQVKCPLYPELRGTERPLHKQFKSAVQIFGGGVLLACGGAFIM